METTPKEEAERLIELYFDPNYSFEKEIRYNSVYNSILCVKEIIQSWEKTILDDPAGIIVFYKEVLTILEVEYNDY